MSKLYIGNDLSNYKIKRTKMKKGTKVYKQIKDDRIAAKRAGNKLKNETYKLAINGLTGNLQSPYSWVYDPRMVLTIKFSRAM